MKVLDMKMYRNKSLTMKVLLGLALAGSFLPRQAGAQVPGNDIKSFNDCVTTVAQNGGTIANAASQCVPSGCYYTNTLSEESGQPACTLKDGTKLPRVIFSCPSASGPALRFRPSFSLCTLSTGPASVMDHIELGEDVAKVIDHRTPQKMGDTTFKKDPLPNAPEIKTDVTNNPDGTVAKRVCNDCHDVLGADGNYRLYGAIAPEVADGTIGTNDPYVKKPSSETPLGVICAGIAIRIPFATARQKDKLMQALGLCTALALKEH